MTRWIQREFVLPEYPRGCHLITDLILSQLSELSDCSIGLLHVFILHTSASLAISENADPDVRTDMNMALNKLAPETWPWKHSCEGPDDMPAHVKAVLTGSSLSIPVQHGTLRCGIWQGIYLCEHRNQGGKRRLVVTLHGEFGTAGHG